MHSLSPQLGAPTSSRAVTFRSRQSGFSLVEVTMAIGIIAFAFVALLGLLPAGLTTFRTAIDTSNETRILQGIIGKAQLMDFQEVPNLDFAKSGEIYYFDEEGSPTDTSLNPVERVIDLDQRIYAAKVFVENPGQRSDDDPAKMLNFSTNIIVVFTNLKSSAAKEFEKLGGIDDLQELLNKKKNARTDLKVRPILLSKMDGVKL